MKKTALILGCAAVLAAVVAGTACAASPVILAGSSAAETAASEESSAEESTAAPESSGPKAEDSSAAEGTEPQDGGDAAAQTGSICIYGTVTEMSEDSLTIDNRSPAFAEGEVIVTFGGGETRLADSQSGLPVGADAFAQGDFVYAWIGETMTLSLPPIVNARVLLTQPAQDAGAPLYGTAAGVLGAADGSVQLTLAGNDTVYTVPADCEIKPFRTRNIVGTEDIAAGREILLWADETGTANRIVLFEE